MNHKATLKHLSSQNISNAIGLIQKWCHFRLWWRSWPEEVDISGKNWQIRCESNALVSDNYEAVRKQRTTPSRCFTTNLIKHTSHWMLLIDLRLCWNCLVFCFCFWCHVWSYILCWEWIVSILTKLSFPHVKHLVMNWTLQNTGL